MKYIERKQVLLEILIHEGWVECPSNSSTTTVLTKTFGERTYEVYFRRENSVDVLVTENHTDGFIEFDNSRWLVDGAWFRSEDSTIAYTYPYLQINGVRLKTSKRVRFSKDENGRQIFLR